MGADLSMDAASFRPGPPKVSWVDRNNILVETEVFYHGYREFYQGPPTKEVMQILNSMGIKELPPMPPMKNTELAEALHDTLCTLNHTDMCGWYYEQYNGVADWNGYAHGRYLVKADKLMKQLPDIPAEEIIRIARTVKEV